MTPLEKLRSQLLKERMNSLKKWDKQKCSSPESAFCHGKVTGLDNALDKINRLIGNQHDKKLDRRTFRRAVALFILGSLFCFDFQPVQASFSFACYSKFRPNPLRTNPIHSTRPLVSSHGGQSVACTPQCVAPSMNNSRIGASLSDTPLPIQDDAETVYAKLTSYCYLETDHRPFGALNCIGTDLREPIHGLRQCAADLNFYPLGTVIELEDGSRRIVADCGGAVKGSHHIDLAFDTIQEMNDWDTRFQTVKIWRKK